MSNAQEREKNEPVEEDRAIPVAMWAVVGILAVWGVGFYVFSAENAPSSQQALAAEAPTIAVAQSAPAVSPGASEAVKTAKTEVAALDGKSIYAAQCQACHQATGMGIPGVFPPLKGADWVTGDAQVLTGLILAGYTGALDVSGVTYNGAMPAFADKLNDAEAAAVISYLRTSLNKEDAVDADFIASVRSQLPSSPFANMDDLKAFAKP